MEARMSRLRLTHATESWIHSFCTTKYEQSVELRRIFTALLPYHATPANLQSAPFLCNCVESRVALVKSIGYLHMYSKIMTDGNATHHNQEPQRSFAVLERVRVGFLTCMFEELEALNRVRRHVLEQTVGVNALAIPAEETRLRQTLSLYEKYNVSQGAKRNAITAKPGHVKVKKNQRQHKSRSFKEFVRYLSGIPKPLIPYSIQVSKSDALLRNWIEEIDMNGVTLKLQMKYLKEIAPKLLVDEKTAEQSTARALTKAHMVLQDASMSNQTTIVPGAPAAHFYSKPIILGDAIFSTDPIIDVFMHIPETIEHSKQREVLHPYMFDFIKDCQTHKEVVSLAFSDEELTFIENPRDRWWCVFTGMPIETTQDGVYITFYFPKHPPITIVVSYSFFESQPVHIQSFLELGSRPTACNAFETVYAKYMKPAPSFIERCKQRGGIFSSLSSAPRTAPPESSGVSTPDASVADSNIHGIPAFEMMNSKELALKLSMTRPGAAAAAASVRPPSAPARVEPLYNDENDDDDDIMKVSVVKTAPEKPPPQPAAPAKTVVSALMQSVRNGMAKAAAAPLSKKRKRGDDDLAGTGNKRANNVSTAAAIKNAEFAQHFYSLLGKTFIGIGQALLGNHSGGGSLTSLTASVLHSTVAVNSEEPEDGKDLDSESSSEDEGKMELIKAIEKEEAYVSLKNGFAEYDRESLDEQIVKVPRLKTKIHVSAWTDPTRVPPTFAVVPKGLSHVPALIQHIIKKNAIDDETSTKFIHTCQGIMKSEQSIEDFIHEWAVDEDVFKRDFFYGMCQVRTLIMQVFYKQSYLKKMAEKKAIALSRFVDDYTKWPEEMWFVEANYIPILQTLLENTDMPIDESLCRSNATASMPALTKPPEVVQAWIERTYPKLRNMTRRLLSFFFRYAGQDATAAADDGIDENDQDEEYGDGGDSEDVKEYAEEVENDKDEDEDGDEAEDENEDDDDE